MAIWQYQLFLLPKEEVISYFDNEYITREALDDIDWWKYRQLNVEHDFKSLSTVLQRNKSWSDRILLFGSEDSNCVDILLSEDSLEKNRIVEISCRIDLRLDYNVFLKFICEFAAKNDCVFVTGSFKILFPDYNIVNADINNYPHFNNFLDKFK